MIPPLFPWKLYDFPPESESNVYSLKNFEGEFKCSVIVTSAFSQTQAHHLPAAQI